MESQLRPALTLRDPAKGQRLIREMWNMVGIGAVRPPGMRSVLFADIPGKASRHSYPASSSGTWTMRIADRSAE